MRLDPKLSSCDGEQTRTLYLYAPIPPVKSGTADYMDALLQRLPGVVRRRFRLVFACEPRHFTRMPNEFRESKVADFRDVVPKDDDISLYFIANNEFHRYSLAALREHKKGIALAMIHDLQCLQNIAATCASGEYGFSRDDLREQLVTELGLRADAFAEAVLDEALPRLFTYLCLAQSMTVQRSAALLVHSYYARARLLLETRPEYVVPPVYVVQHPSDEETTPLSNIAWRSHQPRDRFIASTFGWVAPAKRTTQVIEGFARFRSELSSAERQRVELRIVGQLPPPEYYDPVATAHASGSGDAVRFFGYVSLSEMQDHISQSHLVFNLRFPSCGETSGTLRRCQDLRIPVATTDYAAFREEAADFRINADPEQELDDILSTFVKAYQCWRATGSTHSLAGVSGPTGVSKLSFWEAFLLATSTQTGTTAGVSSSVV